MCGDYKAGYLRFKVLFIVQNATYPEYMVRWNEHIISGMKLEKLTVYVTQPVMKSMKN